MTGTDIERIGRAVVIDSIASAKALVVTLWKGECKLIPSHIETQGDLLLIFLAGAELGLSPMEAMRELWVHDGRVGVGAHYTLARMIQAGIRIKWVESDSSRAVLKLERPGFEPHLEEVTILEAETAGLTRKNNWRNYPKQMLRAQAIRSAADSFCPDVVRGMPVELPVDIDEITYGRPASAEPEVVEGEIEERPDIGFNEIKAETPAGSVTVHRSELKTEVRNEDPQAYDDAQEQKEAQLKWSKKWTDEKALPAINAIFEDTVKSRIGNELPHDERDRIGTDLYMWVEANESYFRELVGYSRNKLWGALLRVAEALGYRDPKGVLEEWLAAALKKRREEEGNGELRE